ncbi:MAG: 50S ribosomal protein L11 methyltransferase [Kofleriaceae bacterium]
MPRGPHPTTFLPMAAGYAPLVGHHRHLLDDRVRTGAFLRAIARCVKPGDVVADLGTGTGVLAIAARRAGARQVFAIDHDPIVRVAAAIARANQVDGITFLEQHAREVVLPRPVDVIISECFGPLAIGGTMIRAVTELRARSLVPGGRMIPERVRLYAAPVDAPRLFAEIAAFARPRYGIRWAIANTLATQNVYNTVIEPRLLLARAGELHAIAFATDSWRGELDATVGFVTTRKGRIHGFAGWFVGELGGGVTLTTAPGKPATIWRQVFLPLAQPIVVAKATPVRFTLRCHGGEHFDWSGTIGDTGFACSTRYSHPAALTS